MVIDLTKKEKQLREESSAKQKSVENWIKNKQRQQSKDSTQNTLSFDSINEDGIVVSGKKYTQIVEFSDISYQLAPEYRQIEIFNEWCHFLNYFDSTIEYQLLFLNKRLNTLETLNDIQIEARNDAFNDVREEYNQVLDNQLAKGNNSMLKRKFIAYTVESTSLENAVNSLNRINHDVINQLQNLGSQVTTLSFTQTVALLHGILNPDEPRKEADYETILTSGLTPKDMVAPMSMQFSKRGDGFKLNANYCKIGYMEILASELSDRMLAELTDLGEMNLLVSFDITPMDQHEAVRWVKGKMSDIDAMKIIEQKKAIRSGYDMDILPPDLINHANESKALLEDLQTRNEHAYLVTITIMMNEETQEKLKNTEYQVKALCQKYNIAIRIPHFQQEEALMTTLPIGNNQLYLDRLLTTSSTAIFIPFTTQELFQTETGSQYYGLNTISNNMIMANRKKLRNPNGLILGTPGSGKSFGAKRELLDCFLTTKDDILVIDPEREYAPLVNKFNGQIVELSPSSGMYVNPLDINENYSEDDNPIALKTDFVMSLCELVLGGKEGLNAVEASVISRVTIEIYRKYFSNPKPENMPILEDLYNELKAQPENEAQVLAKGLEMYVTGAFNFFNNRTNVNLDNRVINFDISGLGKQLKKIGMLIVQDQIWNKVTENRGKIFTRVYIDEFHLLLRDEQTAGYSQEIWKRFRKWGGIPTGITQNVKDLMGSQEIESIFDNSDFVLLYNQSYSDRELLSEKLHISPKQQQYITNSQAGEGLFIYDHIILPFKDQFPQNTTIYELLSTKPGEKSSQE